MCASRSVLNRLERRNESNVTILGASALRRSNGPSISLNCRFGGAIAHMMVPERW
jgi:hypothetical protein